jgi:hypothetical protein
VQLFEQTVREQSRLPGRVKCDSPSLDDPRHVFLVRSMIDPWSMTRWKSLPAFLAKLKAKAGAGENILLSPQTARVLILLLEERKPQRRTPWSVDLYSEGSCIYRLDVKGEILQIEAWARGTIAGRAALASLKEHNPRERFSQRRGSWVEGE